MESNRPNKRLRTTSQLGTISAMADVIIKFVPQGDRYAFTLKYLKQNFQVFQGIDDKEFPPVLMVEGHDTDKCRLFPWPTPKAYDVKPEGPISHCRNFRILFRILCRENVDELPWTLVSVAKLAVEGFKVSDEIKSAIFNAFLVSSSKKSYGKEIWLIQYSLQLAFHLQDEDRFRKLLPHLITLYMAVDVDECYTSAIGHMPQLLKYLVILEFETATRNLQKMRENLKVILKDIEVLFDSSGSTHSYTWLLEHALPILQSEKSSCFQLVEAFELIWRCFKGGMFASLYAIICSAEVTKLMASLKDALSGPDPSAFETRGPRSWLMPGKFIGALPWGLP